MTAAKIQNQYQNQYQYRYRERYHERVHKAKSKAKAKVIPKAGVLLLAWVCPSVGLYLSLWSMCVGASIKAAVSTRKK